MVFGHVRGRYLNDPFFWPILEQAVALGVPIYLHPAPPPQPVIQASYGGFPPEATRGRATTAWGWHIETAIHVLRLIVGGVFDRFSLICKFWWGTSARACRSCCTGWTSRCPRP